MNSKSTSSHSAASFSMDDFAKALDQYDYQFDRGQIVRGKVFEYDSEGAYIDIGGKSAGFVPTKEAGLEQSASLAQLLPIGEEFEFLIVRGQDAEGQIVLSRRQLQMKQAWKNVAAIAESGKSVQIRITGVNKGGVIGEFEGIRGFIPRSHLQQKEELESLVGQLLTATFLEVDPDNKKLILSQRGAIRAAAISSFEVGTLMEGKIVSMKPYGVFVDIDGISSLLHVKQISGNPIDSVTTLFKIGQSIKVVIADIDEYKNRISLSTKVLEAYPGEMIEKMDEVMATATERIEKARELLLSGDREL